MYCPRCEADGDLDPCILDVVVIWQKPNDILTLLSGAGDKEFRVGLSRMVTKFDILAGEIEGATTLACRLARKRHIVLERVYVELDGEVLGGIWRRWQGC